jgi:hypothetical protein
MILSVNLGKLRMVSLKTTSNTPLSHRTRKVGLPDTIPVVSIVYLSPSRPVPEQNRTEQNRTYKTPRPNPPSFLSIGLIVFRFSFDANFTHHPSTKAGNNKTEGRDWPSCSVLG